MNKYKIQLAEFQFVNIGINMKIDVINEYLYTTDHNGVTKKKKINLKLSQNTRDQGET